MAFLLENRNDNEKQNKKLTAIACIGFVSCTDQMKRSDIASLSVLFEMGFHTVKIGHTPATESLIKH